MSMYAVVETETFVRYTDGMWREHERDALISWLAHNPCAGDVIPDTGGLRKIRWSRSSMGKRGGARVIYYNVLEAGQIWLLIAYTKSKFDKLPNTFLRTLREEVERWTRN